MKKKTFIIAEAGVNHNGDVKLAKRMIDAASSAGADAVKFQTFRAEFMVCANAQKAEYQKRGGGASESQHDMLRKLELSKSTHAELIKHCAERGIIFLSSPFDLQSVDLIRGFDLEVVKVPSGELTNLPYLRAVGSLEKRIYLSTGMSTLSEIHDAIAVLMSVGMRKNDIVALHCNSAYPTPYEDVNLRAMISIKESCGVDVGYSDHTMGIEVSVAAVAVGAVAIEKHFTLDRTMEGPDHLASIEPEELKRLVTAIRNVENSLGDGKKQPSPSETENRNVCRKSIVAARDIVKGEKLSVENITTKRPAGGISPMEWDSVIGRVAMRDFGKDEVIVI